MTSPDDRVREFQYNQCIQPSRDSLGKIAWVRLDFLSQGKISDNLIRCARTNVILSFSFQISSFFFSFALNYLEKFDLHSKIRVEKCFFFKLASYKRWLAHIPILFC